MKYFRLKSFFLTLLLIYTSHLFSFENKVVFLLSTPRSLSTAFTRMMTNREDFEVFNEPSTPIFAKRYYPDFDLEFNENSFETYSEINNEIVTLSKQKHIFIKELGDRSIPLFDEFPEYFESSNVHFVFLIRNPHQVAISNYRSIQKMDNPNIEDYDLSAFVSSKSLWQAYLKVKKRAKNLPTIIQADDLANHSEETIKLFCQNVQIPYSEKHLTWKTCDLEKNELPNWRENKGSAGVSIWHSDVLESTHFHPTKPYTLDDFGNPTFEEIENLKDRKIVRLAYLKNLPYYQNFLREKK